MLTDKYPRILFIVEVIGCCGLSGRTNECSVSSHSTRQKVSSLRYKHIMIMAVLLADNFYKGTNSLMECSTFNAIILCRLKSYWANTIMASLSKPVL